MRNWNNAICWNSLKYLDSVFMSVVAKAEKVLGTGGGSAGNKSPRPEVADDQAPQRLHALPHVNDSTPSNRVNPWWIVGITDGEGNFSVEISKNEKAGTKTGYSVTLSYNVTQHGRNRVILDRCLEFFGVGTVRDNNKKTGMMIYRVRDRQQLKDVIFPHFDQYPLQGNKNQEYLDFKKAWDQMDRGEHLTLEGLAKLRIIKEGMNRGRK